jgi:ribosome recycling factor
MRNIRREINDEFKKLESEGKITEDDLISSQKEVQEITDEFTEKINDSLAQKEKEIMEV